MFLLVRFRLLIGRGGKPTAKPSSPKLARHRLPRPLSDSANCAFHIARVRTRGQNGVRSGFRSERLLADIFCSQMESRSRQGRGPPVPLPLVKRRRKSNSWLWLKIKQEGLRRSWSMFPLTRVPFCVPVFLSHSQLTE